jgi:putative ABC transport system permease protein
MIYAIDRKLLRDVWQIRGQALAIAAVIMCGVSSYVMSLSAVASLQLTRDTYYDNHRFADVFANMKRAPKSLMYRIKHIPGVAFAEDRIVRDVTLDVPGLAEPAVGRLISLPDDDRTALNTVYMRNGRLPDPNRDDEVLCGEAFALAHNFGPGNKVSAVINGRKKQLHIVGVALSPEYIFQFRAGDFFPDDKRFGVFWMPRRPLEYAFDMRGAFNDVCLTLAPGANEREIIRQLDELTENYGGLGAHGRDEQFSHKFVSDEFEQLKRMSGIAPTIFLGVAAFLLNIVLSRIIASQREQIAALKAFGYTNLGVGWHFLKMTGVIVLLGVVTGIIGGIGLGQWLTMLYAKFYRFPLLKFTYNPDVFVGGAVVTSIAALIGTIAAVRRAVKLPPAEAMRPPAPANYRPTILERVGLAWMLSPAARMILRHLERRPIHAGLSMIGIAMGSAILIMGFFIGDAFDVIIDVQFYAAHVDDVSVAFIEPRSAGVMNELAHLPGVRAVEPFRAVPVRLRHGPNYRRTALQGVTPDSRLHRLLDDKCRPIQIPPEGLVLGRKLAEVLGVRTGEEVIIEVLEGNRPVRPIPVAATIDEFIGAGAYMERKALNRLIREGDTVSGGYLAADPNAITSLYDTLKRRPGVASVSVREATLKNFNDIQAENMRIIKTFYIGFGLIIAFGVVYNSAQVSLSERSRELASLRVLGFTRVEIATILLGELAVLVLASLPLGMVLGYGLANMIASSVDTEQIRIPLVISSSTYSMAAIVVLASAVVSGWIVRRKLNHLDLVAVLKTQY